MSYEFTKLSGVPAVSEFPEGANAIIETNGEIKRCPSSNTPKPLTYDYMPEGYPKKTLETTTLMEEQEIAFASEYEGVYGAHLREALEIAEGKTYNVNWDGTEYECVCFVYNSTPMLGNLSISGAGDDTGEPFLYVYNRQEPFVQFYTLDTSASHTISIKTTWEIVTPMAEEFIPDTALITYNSSTSTYSSDLTNDELYERLLGGKQVVLHKAVENEYLYLTKWNKKSNGSISLAFAGDDYSVSLRTDGTIGKYIMT